MQTEAFESIISFGQYLHWSQLQFDHFRTFNEKSNDSDFIGALVHWLGSVYVAAEAWHDLDLSDVTITNLITKHDDMYTNMRRFRNAVYHFQPKPMSVKLTDFLLPGDDSNAFARALQFELQRFLVSSVPNDLIGAEIRLAIGWWPSDPLVLLKARGGGEVFELNAAMAFLTPLHQNGVQLLDPADVCADGPQEGPTTAARC
jgi:hypothetical protein